MSGSALIPFSGLDRQYKAIREEILDITDKVYSTGKVLQGPNTTAFEQAIAKRCSRKYAVAVNSGTQALVLAYLAVGLTTGDRIVVPALSFYATVNALTMNGLDPVFVDVDEFCQINTDKAIELFFNTEHTKAISAVDLFGGIPDYDKFESAKFVGGGMKIIEDAAQSLGASRNGRPAGSFGDVSILSFDPMKNLPCYGSGGMVLTDDLSIYDMLLNLRNNGAHSNHAVTGTNSKMSEVDCAQMLVKLKYFDCWQARRKQIADYYRTNLKCAIHSHHPDVSESYHKFVIYTPGLPEHLSKKLLHSHGVETKRHYHKILPLCKSSHWNGNPYDEFPISSDVTACALSLPIYPELSDPEVEHIVKSVNRAF